VLLQGSVQESDSMITKQVHVIGGGTVSHVRGHLALCAPAYGGTARRLFQLAKNRFDKMEVNLHLSKLAVGGEVGGNWFETNEDLKALLEDLATRPETKIIFMNAAVCDFNGTFTGGPSGKHQPRISTREGVTTLTLEPAEKLLGHIRKDRKDIFVVAFKETTGATEDEQYIAALNLCKEASVNLVLANDTVTRNNIIVTPEEARYCSGSGYTRDEVLEELVDMAWHRSQGAFTRSKVIGGEAVPWDSAEVPESLRTVVNWCIEKGAYKPFRGVTTGHFACKIADNLFLTSIRKTNFNAIESNGLVKIKTDGPDDVIAYGMKPSVGGQSQRIIFSEHPEFDCIVHFHCPLKEGGRNVEAIPVVSQREYECGSHQCGQNTSNGLAEFLLPSPVARGLSPDNRIAVVYLDNHGPNIVFNRRIDPQLVMDFIDENFDLSRKTGGSVELVTLK
jgi:hypothetical protein